MRNPDDLSIPRAMMGVFNAVPGIGITSCKFEGVTFSIGGVDFGPFTFDVDENGQVVRGGSVDLPRASGGDRELGG
jgi:hypothetical protein